MKIWNSRYILYDGSNGKRNYGKLCDVGIAVVMKFWAMFANIIIVYGIER